VQLKQVQASENWKLLIASDRNRLTTRSWELGRFQFNWKVSSFKQLMIWISVASKIPHHEENSFHHQRTPPVRVLKGTRKKSASGNVHREMWKNDHQYEESGSCWFVEIWRIW
jgi:hypothetical protein